VVAPSLIPVRSGERIKTDRRDALKLARLHRAGELTGVRVPAASDEAMRDLCRARTDAVQDLRRRRAQLKAFLLRNGYRYTGKSAWTEAHRRYLRELVLPHPAQRVVLEDTIAAIGSAEERIARLEEQMTALLPSWPMQPGSPTLPASLVPSASSVVAALMGIRGFARVGAMVLVSELGGAWRFAHPRQLMSCLGLVPSENTSDQKRRQGGSTKTGNSHARWLLIEAAHHYRLSPKVSKELSVRQQGLSPEINHNSGNQSHGQPQSAPVLERLSRLVERKAIGAWLREPNAAFDGSTPWQVIERGEGDRLWRMIYEMESGQPD